jgi:hypothetical protein
MPCQRQKSFFSPIGVGIDLVVVGAFLRVSYLDCWAVQYAMNFEPFSNQHCGTQQIFY